MSYLGFNKVTEGAACLEPVRLAEVLVESLDALVEGHVGDGLLVQHLEQVVQLLCT